MPFLIIHTNRDLDEPDITELLLECSQLTAATLGKPESYVMTQFKGGQNMTFAGSSEPLAYLELKSIGLPESETPSISASLCQFIEDKLGIPPQRIYIEFSDASRKMWGWNGATF